MFKIKRLLCFSLIKNEANTQVLHEIVERFTNFEQNKEELLFDSNELVKEITTEM